MFSLVIIVFPNEDMSNILPQTEFQENDVGVYITCDGDMKYGILFHLQLSDAKKLASKLLRSEQSDNLSLEGRSAVAEIGNILAASFFRNKQCICCVNDDKIIYIYSSYLFGREDQVIA